MRTAERIKELEQEIASLKGDLQRESMARLAVITEQMKALFEEATSIAKACDMDYSIELGQETGSYDTVSVPVKGEAYWDSSSAYC